ncbi:MAG TPA: TIGR03621 family F420-dependent LLM class oxidoreductase [Thermomicrobiaceae bacterium]|nr:TIGR03621 family F420-dependent LLM class oxidoreductase [Thermomicrobiaceae bacterium]
MMSNLPMHAFRFGVVAAQARSGDDWAEKARHVERLGFATLVVPDGLRYTLAPMPALVAAAAATQSLRVGTYVIANDYRHPVMLAKEAATVDWLSGGRLELGIGAGRPDAATDNAMLGLPFDSGRVRLERLAESLAIVKPLLSGQTVDFTGRHYRATGAAISPAPAQLPPPLLIAGGQRRMLELAAHGADIIALGIEPGASVDEVVERVEWIRAAAGSRFAQLELNINLMAVGGRLPRYLQHTLGAAAEQLAKADAVPVLKGSVDQMCDRLEWLRRTLGISYVMVGEELVDALAPVVERLAGA